MTSDDKIFFTSSIFSYYHSPGARTTQKLSQTNITKAEMLACVDKLFMLFNLVTSITIQPKPNVSILCGFLVWVEIHSDHRVCFPAWKHGKTEILTDLLWLVMIVKVSLDNFFHALRAVQCFAYYFYCSYHVHALAAGEHVPNPLQHIFLSVMQESLVLDNVALVSLNQH